MFCYDHKCRYDDCHRVSDKYLDHICFYHQCTYEDKNIKCHKMRTYATTLCFDHQDKHTQKMLKALLL